MEFGKWVTEVDGQVILGKWCQKYPRTQWPELTCGRWKSTSCLSKLIRVIHAVSRPREALLFSCAHERLLGNIRINTTSCYDSRSKELHVEKQQLYTPWTILHLKDQGLRILFSTLYDMRPLGYPRRHRIFNSCTKKISMKSLCL